MQFVKLNRSDAENAYRSVLNVSGATITTGLPVSLVNSSTDGVSAVVAGSAAANVPGFIGVATKDIANNDYGRVQVNGFVNSVLLSNLGTSVTVNANDPLVPNGVNGFASAAPTYANSGFRYLHASNLPAVLSASGYASGLLKAVA